MNPNHYLAVAIQYLYQHRARLARRRGGGQDAGFQFDDRPCGSTSGPPVGRGAGGLQMVRATAWWTARSASAARKAPGASFLRKDGTVWTTDKDGIILDLLAAEITAVTGRDPGVHYQASAAKFGAPCLSSASMPHECRAEGGTVQTSRRSWSRRRRWPAKPSSPS